MKNKGKKFRDLKIGYKLLIAFVFSALLPILGIQIFNLYMNKKSLEEKVNTLMVNQLTQIAERVDLNLDVYSTIIYQMDADDYLKDNIQIFMGNDKNRQAMAQHDIYRQLQSYKIAAEGIRCISIICEDGRNVTYDWTTASMVENIWEDYIDLRQIRPYENAENSRDVVITPAMSTERNGEELRMFHISKRIYNLDNIQEGPFATVVISIDESLLNRLCRQTAVDNESGNMEEYSINYILDREGTIISYPDSFFAGSVLEEGKSMEEFVAMTGQLKNRNISVNTYEDENKGWIFFNAYDAEYMFRDIRRNMKISLLFGTVTMAAAFVMMITIVRCVRKSADEITAGIREIQDGKLDIKVCVESQDEFGQIADNLNTMAEKIKNLIAQVRDMADKKKNAEVKALEAQINPHFLYNTLDSINWLAISHNEYEVSTMICNLASILRYSVNKSNQMVTVREAADWMEKYISLQQMRFRNSFVYDIDIEDCVMEMRIYKLLLQPFLENSMIHGFKGISQGGSLQVSIFSSEQAKVLNIIIEDNGRGMPEESVRRFNDREWILREESSNIGLQNVFSRMDMYYGADAKWNISSIENLGTVVALKIPGRKQIDENRNSRR